MGRSTGQATKSPVAVMRSWLTRRLRVITDQQLFVVFSGRSPVILDFNVIPFADVRRARLNPDLTIRLAESIVLTG
jgi:hypothetical protein